MCKSRCNDNKDGGSAIELDMFLRGKQLDLILVFEGFLNNRRVLLLQDLEKKTGQIMQRLVILLHQLAQHGRGKKNAERKKDFVIFLLRCLLCQSFLLMLNCGHMFWPVQIDQIKYLQILVYYYYI